MMIDTILNYIRGWFPESENELSSRKRKFSDSAFATHVRKYRRLNPVFDVSDNEYYTPPKSFRRSNNSTMQSVVIDDDYLPKTSKSTPRRNVNQDNDISFVKVTNSSTQKKENAKKLGMSFITRFNSNYESIKEPSPNGGIGNGAKPKTRIPLKRSTPSSLDYCIQLDSRKEYESLLDSVILKDSFNNSSIYGTPICTSFNRSKRLVELARSPRVKSLETIDLTDENNSKLSTKERVIKILDEFRTEPAIIDDSDSDVEILPTPPSPKPDIKVDPINSLKTVIDTSNATKQTWLDDVTKKHERYLEDKSREIQVYADNSSSLNQINRDLLIQSLTRKVQDSLAIKDTILPIIEIEEEIELPALTEEQHRMIKKAFSGRDKYEVLTKKFSLNVNRMDILTLSGLNWLNDNVINFYMNLIIERSTESTKWPKSYAMNTFFYQKLVSGGPSSLRRWTRKVDIFAHEFICVPIHLGMHWCMAIIDLKAKTIKYYDSMGKPNNQCLAALKNYLEYEHQDKKGEPFSTEDFVLENVQDIPQQMNGSDCGMFSCTFAEFASRKGKFTFSQKDMPYLRNKMVVEILTGQLLIN